MKNSELFKLNTYVSPSSEVVNIRPNRPVLQSGTLGNVGEGDPDKDDWYD